MSDKVFCTDMVELGIAGFDFSTPSDGCKGYRAAAAAIFTRRTVGCALIAPDINDAVGLDFRAVLKRNAINTVVEPPDVAFIAG